MFSKLSVNIPFLIYVIFGNFGGSRYLVLKIIVLDQIKESPPTLAISQFMHNSTDITKLYKPRSNILSIIS